MSGSVAQGQMIHFKETRPVHSLRFYVLVNFVIQNFYFEKCNLEANSLEVDGNALVMVPVFKYMLRFNNEEFLICSSDI